MYKNIFFLFWRQPIVLFPILFSLFVWFKCEYLFLVSTLFVFDCSQYVATDKKDTIKLICWSSFALESCHVRLFCYSPSRRRFKHLTVAIALSNLRLMETPWSTLFTWSLECYLCLKTNEYSTYSLFILDFLSCTYYMH